MASAQVVKTSVTNNSPSQDSNHPDDLFQSRKHFHRFFSTWGQDFTKTKRKINENLKRTKLGLALVLGISLIPNNGIPSRLSKSFSEKSFHKRSMCKFDNKQSHLLNFFDLFVQPTDHLICGVWDLFYHHQADKRIHLKTQRMQLQDKAQGNKTASHSSQFSSSSST